MRSGVGAFWNGSRRELRWWLDLFFLPVVDDLCVALDAEGAADFAAVCAALVIAGLAAVIRRPSNPVMANLRIFELGSSLSVVSRSFAVTFPGWLAAADPIMDIFGFGSSGSAEFGAYRAPVPEAA